MKRRLAAVGVVAVAAAIVLWLWPREEARFTAEELWAIEAAWAAVPDSWDKGDKWHVEVTRNNGVIVVTWPNPPGTSLLQGDFRFRVQVRARTYEVIAIAVGS